MSLRAPLASLLRALHLVPRPGLDVVLYTKRACLLCDEMKAEIRRARPRARLRTVEVDIESDPELLRRFGRSVPVLAIGGRPAFKGRLTARELEQRVARHLAEAGARPGLRAAGASGESRSGREASGREASGREVRGNGNG